MDLLNNLIVKLANSQKSIWGYSYFLLYKMSILFSWRIFIEYCTYRMSHWTLELVTKYVETIVMWAMDGVMWCLWGMFVLIF